MVQVMVNMVQVMVYLQNFTYPNIDLYWSILEILFQSMRQKLGKRNMQNRIQGASCTILLEKTENLFGKGIYFEVNLCKNLIVLKLCMFR